MTIFYPDQNVTISRLIGKSEAILKKEKPDILVNSIGADTAELRILIWISSVYDQPAFKKIVLK